MIKICASLQQDHQEIHRLVNDKSRDFNKPQQVIKARHKTSSNTKTMRNASHKLRQKANPSLPGAAKESIPSSIV